jgi:hypothetical protein
VRPWPALWSGLAGARNAPRRVRNLILLDLALIAACVPGIFNVLAKDHVSTTEGVVAWVSAIAFVLLALGLVVLIGVAARRFARRA